LHGSPALDLGGGLPGQQSICHGGLWLDIFPLLERPEGGVDQPRQGPPPGLGQDHFERGGAGGRVRREHRDAAQEPPRAFGPEHRVQAAPGGVKTLERSEAPLGGLGGRGQADMADAADAPGPLLVHAGDPGGQASVGRPFPPPRESAPHGACIPPLQHLVHQRLAQVPRGRGLHMRRSPVGATLLVMNATPDRLGPRHQGGGGL
jgi:hypothetical protein